MGLDSEAANRLSDMLADRDEFRRALIRAKGHLRDGNSYSPEHIAGWCYRVSETMAAHRRRSGDIADAAEFTGLMRRFGYRV